MKYGRIAGNTSINAAIYHCFDFITEADTGAFARKFAEQPHDQDQVMHTFRELILGAFLASNGLSVRSERPVAGKTPDWCILDGEDLRCIIELVNFHTAKATEDEIKAHFAAGKAWAGWEKPHANRLYSSVHNKCVAYKGVAESEGVPYVVGVYGDFLADVDRQEVEVCLCDQETGLFNSYPEVSGVLFFDDNFARYRFNYLPNPQAKRPLALPEGVMDLSLYFR
ncbi:MAG: hypothetical protein ABSH35_32275 [Isosphaeraceae bacterium]|jgi:hypothetical protein